MEHNKTINTYITKCVLPAFKNRQKYMRDVSLWNSVLKNRDVLDAKKKKIEYLLNEFGTKEPCNRFNIGNCIEIIMCELLKECGLHVTHLPNAKRVDMYIHRYGSLSIKYSSVGDITLHNSNSCVNKDESFTDLMLITKQKIYLITHSSLVRYGVQINDYIKNTGDSLKLKRKILNTLQRVGFPHVMDFKLHIDIQHCKNRLTNDLFYATFTKEYNAKT